MTREGTRGTASLVAVVAALLLGTLPAGCNDNGGNPAGSCTQPRCESGSESCCYPVLPGTWDPAAMVCSCPAPGTDGDADGDDVPAADADGDDTTDSSDPCYPYPCSPYGTRLGNVFRDYAFTPVNDPATTMAGADGVFDFHDLFQGNEAHGGNLKALFVFVTSVWCPVCRVEAQKLQALYEELQPLGVEFVGVITDGPTPGRPATASQGATYAATYHWTFPAVIDSEGNVDTSFWAPSDVGTDGSVGVPLNMFFDLRNMRLYGRFAGGTDAKLPRYFLTEIATAPQWTDTFARDFNFDCAPGTGTETEPNSLGETPEDGTTLPFELSGVQCPPAVGDGMLIDEDDIDLGTLAVGTVIDATVTAGTGSNVYPAVTMGRVVGTSFDGRDGPVMMGTAANGRQWVIDTAGHYYLSIADGRLGSLGFYGDATPPVADQCCEGGPEYTYSVNVAPFTLAPTDAAVTSGTSPSFTLDDGDLNVHPLDVTTGTPVTVRLISPDTDIMDPYLVLWDPATSTVLGFNDDEDLAGGNYNSLLTLTPATTGTIWVVAGYYVAFFRGGPPSYTIQID